MPGPSSSSNPNYLFLLNFSQIKSKFKSIQNSTQLLFSINKKANEQKMLSVMEASAIRDKQFCVVSVESDNIGFVSLQNIQISRL